jgi:hypothetical protein
VVRKTILNRWAIVTRKQYYTGGRSWPENSRAIVARKTVLCRRTVVARKTTIRTDRW